jgi:hypothetical protein
MRASGGETTSSWRLKQSFHIWTWKESEAWSITERRPDGLLRRPDGCNLEQKLLDTVKGPDRNPRLPDGWCLVCLASGRYGTSSGRMEQWTDERPDGKTRRTLSIGDTSDTQGHPLRTRIHDDVYPHSLPSLCCEYLLWMSSIFPRIMHHYKACRSFHSNFIPNEVAFIVRIYTTLRAIQRQ